MYELIPCFWFQTVPDDFIDSKSAKFRSELPDEWLEIIENDEDYFTDSDLPCTFINIFWTLEINLY